MPPPLPSKPAWVTFAGDINDAAVNRFFNLGAYATINQFTSVHLLFQSTGGMIGSGIALYNYFRTLPIELTIYNSGTVASVATVAYLGAKSRVASPSSSFMVHRTWISPLQITSEKAQQLAQSLIIDDNRVEAILRNETALSDDQWAVHKVTDLWIDAQAAINAKIAGSIGDFSPPLGTILNNV